MLKIKPKYKDFKEQKTMCCLGVSLHSSNHTGMKLAIIVDYINQNFKSCVIDLSDTLYVYHYMASGGLSYIEAYYQARAEGDKWLLENKTILSNLKIPYQIIRWDHWKNDRQYRELHDEYVELFNSNKTFKEALMQDIQNYHARRRNIDVSKMPARFLQNSVAYLLEEITCHTLLARSLDCVNVYPGKQLECFRVIREGIIPNAPHGLESLNHVRLNIYDDSADSKKQAA